VRTMRGPGRRKGSLRLGPMVAPEAQERGAVGFYQMLGSFRADVAGETTDYAQEILKNFAAHRGFMHVILLPE